MNAEIERDVEAANAMQLPPDASSGVSDNDLSSWPDRIQILFIAVNDAQGKLRLDEEHRAVRRSLERWPDRFALDSLLAVRIDELGEDLRRRSPDVLHFGGHGTRTGGLMFHDGMISTDAFEALLRALRGNVKLAVLNACFSMHQAKAVCDVTGIAIGMRRQVSDAAAVAFSRALYGALAESRSVRDAFDLARVEIRLAGKPEDADVPALFVRAGLDASRIQLPRVAARAGGPRRSGRTGKLRGPSLLLPLPIVVAIAVLAIARWWQPSGGDELAIKVKFIDEARQPVKLTGKARLESDAYTPTVLVDNSDLVAFEQVPHRLDGRDAAFTVDSHAFRVVSPLRRYRLQANGIIYLELQPIVAKISGTVRFIGERLPGGQISLTGYDCSGTIRNGYFEIPCPDVKLPVKAEVREPEAYAKRVCNRDLVLQEPTNNELVLGACPPPPLLPLVCSRSPGELIRREAELVQRHDLNGVVRLFAPGALIGDAQTDVRQPPRDRYRAELDKHRFVAASHADIQCAPSDARIWFCTSSSAGSFDDRTGYNNPPGSDHWVLERQDGCWWIRSLTINAAGKPFGP